MIYVSIMSADHETLLAFSERFGGSVRPVKKRVRQRRQQFHYCRSGVAAQTILRAIEPFLIEKRHIAQLALQCDFSRSTYRVSDEEVAKRYALVEQISSFNNRVTVQ